MKVLERLKLWTPQERAERVVNDLYNATVKLELFDADTGKLKERVEGDNYATDILLNSIKWYARQWISARIAFTSPTNDSSNANQIDFNTAGTGGSSPTRLASQITDYGPNNGISAVILTTDAHAEDATDDRILRGALTAWSYCDGYTGADTFRGTENVNESLTAPTKSLLVFDWPTNSGNGTIASVHWGLVNISSSAYANTNDLWIMNGPTQATDTGWGSALFGAVPAGFTSANSGNWAEKGLWLDPDGLHYWTLVYNNAASTTNLVKRALADGSVTSTTSLGTSLTYSQVMGFCFDGTFWWTLDASSGQLKKWNTSGVLQSSTSVTSLGMPALTNSGGTGAPVFIDKNNMIWVGYGNHMYQINPATPSLVTTLSISTQGGISQFGSQPGCYYTDATNGDELWIASASTRVINRYDLSGNFRGAFGYLNGNVSSSFTVGISPQGFTYVLLQSQSQAASTTDVLYPMTSMRQFWTRTLLPSSVTKANTQTMKLTYEFDYS